MKNFMSKINKNIFDINNIENNDEYISHQNNINESVKDFINEFIT